MKKISQYFRSVTFINQNVRQFDRHHIIIDYLTSLCVISLTKKHKQTRIQQRSIQFSSWIFTEKQSPTNSEVSENFSLIRTDRHRSMLY